MRRFRLGWVVVLVAFALAAAACGDERDDDTAADATTTSAAAGGEGTTTAAPETTAGGDGAATTTAATPAAEMFGDMEWPCGPGDASGATDQGISDEAITIGIGDDRGFAGSPGLNKAQTDAVEAFIAECNALGGINGRTIEYNVYDAAITNVATAMLDACDQVFMLVGHGFTLDNLGEETRQTCGLASAPAWTVSADAAQAPLKVVGLPNPADQLPLSQGYMMAELFPDLITNTGIVLGNFAATRETAEKTRVTHEELGYEFPITLEYDINGEADWNPFVNQLADAGAGMVYFTGSCLPNYQGIRRASAQQGYEAIWFTDANFYEFGCAEANADGAMDDTYVRMATIPLTEGDANPATGQFVDIVTGNGGDLSLLGAQAVSSFLLWATAARDCGSDLTRDCVLANMEAVHEWTGGGLHVPVDPGANLAPTCGMLVKLEGTEYVRVRPEEPGTYECDDAWRAEGLVTPAVTAAQLGPDRVSTLYSGG